MIYFSYQFHFISCQKAILPETDTADDSSGRGFMRGARSADAHFQGTAPIEIRAASFQTILLATGRRGRIAEILHRSDLLPSLANYIKTDIGLLSIDIFLIYAPLLMPLSANIDALFSFMFIINEKRRNI